MAIFRMYDCDFSVTVNGVVYSFAHVDGVTVENPERTRLVRGANAGNTEGLVFVEGVKEAKTFTLTVYGMTADVHNLLKNCYKDKTRIEANVVSRSDGSSKIAKNAILVQSPMQLAMSDSADSLTTALIFESYDVEENHKS